MVTAYLILLGFIALERLLELVISARNRRWALSQGGREFGENHFTAMKLLHTALLIGCAAEVVLLKRPFHFELAVVNLPLLVAAQALRYWAIFSLGRFWNVRVIVVPGAHVVTGGPYRYFRHPNYLAVIIEGIAIPMIHTAWITALVFTVLNLWLLRTRTRCEETALTEHCQGYR